MLYLKMYKNQFADKNVLNAWFSNCTAGAEIFKSNYSSDNCRSFIFKKNIMKKLLVAGVFFTVSCGSGGNTNASSDNADTSVKKGNSAGSNIVEMDTLHMDTGTHKTNDSAH